MSLLSVTSQYDIKKPHGKILNRPNDILPFENITPVEEFSRKNDASLFMFASHNKKRPHNLILGECYRHYFTGGGEGQLTFCVLHLLITDIYCFISIKDSSVALQNDEHLIIPLSHT